MTNAVITGGILAAQQRKEQMKQKPLGQYNPPLTPHDLLTRQALDRFPSFLAPQDSVRFGMGVKEDVDDVITRQSKVLADSSASYSERQQAERAYRDVRALEQDVEKVKDRTEAAATASGAAFGSVLGPAGAAVAGFGGFIVGKVIGNDNKERSFRRQILEDPDSEAFFFKHGRFAIINKVSEGKLGAGTYSYYNRFGNRDSFEISERQARILQTRPSNRAFFDRNKDAYEMRQIDEVLDELDAFKDTKKDPDHTSGKRTFCRQNLHCIGKLIELVM